MRLDLPKPFSSRMWSVSLIAFLGVAMFIGSMVVFSTAATTQSFNNVQVFVTTKNSTDDSFQVSAYNTTGGLIASTNTEYPAASFELPSGTYLLTVIASQRNSYPVPMPLAQSASANPYPIASSPAEYGYNVLNVAGSTSVSINTSPISDFNTTVITVHVTFVNGTSAANATVGGSVVGVYYWLY